ncbi:hypothetical protein M413DRAFT_444635 [Hebeloma cylindrosporum]|uniref:DUF6534 domain-containing protein n=1 Tax=Hebeloma cylindrosporum TaxID=76867 RepID=A0A0C3CF09_HEBCY|nr:hypothetical protein M413DRAFT_444635 [Hebeloma cylindrosporum h7]
MAVTATIENTLGAVFLGLIGWAILFGAISIQVFLYYSNFPDDRRLQKIIVGALMAVSMVHLAFPIYTTYISLISNFGNTNSQMAVSWIIKVQTSLDSAIILTVKGLYTWRVYTLGKHFSRMWSLVVVAVAAMGWAFGIAVSVEFNKIEEWNDIYRFRTLLFTSLAVLMTTDIVLAGSLCYYLHKSRSIYTRTNGVLVRIMHYAIVCGFFTSAFATANLICATTIPDTYVHIGIEYLLPRLHVFSYMSLLNARKTVSERDDSSFNVSRMLNEISRFDSG